MGSSKVINALVVAALVVFLILSAALPVAAEGPYEVDHRQPPTMEWWGEGQHGVVDVPANPVVTGLDGETRTPEKLKWWWWSANLGSRVE